MPAEITQQNVRLLIPGKAAQVASMIAAKRNISLKTALLSFYRSKTYQELERESSKYWHYSPAQLFAVSGFSRKHRTFSKHGPGRSVLLAYKDEILTAWRNRQSAKMIADWLGHKGVSTTPQNVWKFIKRHSEVTHA